MLDSLPQSLPEIFQLLSIVVFFLTVIAAIAQAIVAIRDLVLCWQRFHRRKRLTENKTQSKGKQQAQLPPQLLSPKIEKLPTGEGTDQYQFESKEDDKVLRFHNE